MKNNFEIVDLYPIPLYIGNLPSHLSSITSFLNSQETTNDPSKKYYGSRSVNSYILNESPCLKLSNHILNETLNYGSNFLGYGYKEYKFSQSWISHKSPGESHVRHTHPNSLISGVLYYGDFDTNTPSIIIHNPKPKVTLRPKIDPSKINQYSSQEFYLKPTPGMLILFPSDLDHSVPENTTNQIRKSLAFNIVPTEGFGMEEELTELKFN
jgi:uncharacterized protein (TIGR02466 family)